MYGYGYSLYNRTPFLGGGGAAPVNSVAPVISGTQTVGQTLTSTTGTWTGIPAPTFTYQWYRGASLISGATSSTYVLVQADAGNTTAIKCVVTATNSAGVVSADSNTLTGILDANAAAYLTATGITGTTQRNAINTLNIGLKQDGLWSKMKAVYPFVTDNRNLMSYSEDFSNAYWSKSGATVTANNTTAPDGTLTADRIVYSTTNNYVYGVSTLSGGVGTQSFYVKGTAGETLYADDGYTSAPLITLTGNWQRVEFTTTRSSGQLHGILIGTYSGATARTIWLWGAQVDAAATATTYQPIATTQQAFISNQFKYNLVNPVDSDAAFRLVFNGGWTHSANGATPNGTNGYADTKLVPSSVLTLNSTHISSYIRNTSQGILLGSDFVGRLWIAPNFNGTQKYLEINTGTVTTPSATISTATGLWLGSRIVSSQSKLYNNASINYSHNTSSVALDTLPIYLSARNASGNASNYTSAQVAFSSIGDGLTDTEAANLYTRVQAFQTALSRQV